MPKLYPAPLVLAASGRYQLASYAGEQWQVLLGYRLARHTHGVFPSDPPRESRSAYAEHKRNLGSRQMRWGAFKGLDTG